MKLRGLVVVLAIAGSFSGIWACGKIVDEVGKDGGGQDATAYSSGDVMVGDAALDSSSSAEAEDASWTDAPSDLVGDVAVADATPDVLSAPEAGDASGTADVGVDAPSCSEAPDSGSSPPSCAPGGAGMTNCGPGGSGSESCCRSLEVCGGTYYRTYANDGGGPTGEAHPATISSFRLDEYLVTVGRFRQFVAAWNNGSRYYPAAGSGKHTHLNGGAGLANGASAGAYETGWDAVDWNNTADIDPTTTTASLQCWSPYNTWTASAGSHENLPINCVNWWESYAFCIWDGGFLPSEAESEYAAAAGNQQREYPWGSTAPGIANQYAIYDDYYTANPTYIAPVGYASLGAGYWGQLDLAGELIEWNLDGYNSTHVDPCIDCAYLPTSPAFYRVLRGDAFGGLATALLPSGPFAAGPTSRAPAIGFRCARTP